MTYLEAGNKSYREAREAAKLGRHNKAAQLFDHAKRMYQHHEWQFGKTTSPAINAATRMLRQSIQKRDAA